MRLGVKFGFVAFCSAWLAGGNPLLAQTMEEELSDLLLSHPQIQSAYKVIASRSQEINKAAAGFLPSMNLSSDYGPEFIDSPSERAQQDGGKPWSRARTVTTFSLTQNLFDGLATTSSTRTARLNKLVSESELDTTTQNVIMEGVSAYIDVLRQLQLVDLAGQNEETIQIQLNLEDERVKKGSGIAVDVLQAKSRLQLAKERRVRFEGALENSFSRYTQVFDHPPEIEKLVEPVPAADLIPDSLETAIDISLAENPAVTNADRKIEMARERRQSVRSELFPSIDVVGTVNYEKHRGAVIGTRRDMSLLLQANWDFFTGFTARANAAQAAYDFSATQDNYDFVVRKVIEQTRLAWQALRTAGKRLGLLENAVNIASEVFDSRKKLRAAGKETVINVLDAEGEIANARINFAGALFDEREAVYRLLLAMGRLILPELEQAAVEPRETVPEDGEDEEERDVLEGEPERPGDPETRDEPEPPAEEETPSRDTRDEFPQEDSPFEPEPRDGEPGDGAPPAPIEDRDLPPRDPQNRLPV